jgi:YgiT-type zinc finger domain-containing protein
MKCVICKGSDIVVKTVDEQIAVGVDILLIRLNLPVCSQCGERYYDRKAMQIIEDVRAKGKQRVLAVEEVGKILRTKDHQCDALSSLAA